VLDDEDVGEGDPLPPCQHQVQLLRAVGRIDERHSVQALLEPLDPLHRVALEDAAPLRLTERGHVGLQRMQRGPAALHEVDGGRAARERLEPERSRACEEIQDAAVAELLLDEGDAPVAHLLGGGSDVPRG
jgi:hypothetical protein